MDGEQTSRDHGEILASESVCRLARRMDGLAYVDRGPAGLKGLAEPVRVIQVIPEHGQTPRDAVQAVGRERW